MSLERVWLAATQVFSLPPSLLLWNVGGLAVKSVATLMIQVQQLWDGVLPITLVSEWSFQKASVKTSRRGGNSHAFWAGQDERPSAVYRVTGFRASFSLVSLGSFT
jgi:hypothetical protein